MSVRPRSIRFIALVCLPPRRRLPLTARSDGFSFFVAKRCPSRVVTFRAARSQISAPFTQILNAGQWRIVIDGRRRSPMTPVASRILTKNRFTQFPINRSIFQIMRMFHNKSLFFILFLLAKLSTGGREKRTPRRIVRASPGKKRPTLFNQLA
jgi:hypothetical protein